MGINYEGHSKPIYHERRKIIFVFLGLGPQIVQIKITIGMHFGRNDFQASHNSRLNDDKQRFGGHRRFDHLTAGLVPCALRGIRQISRWLSPRDSWYARITQRPAYSPAAPELGCKEAA